MMDWECEKKQYMEGWHTWNNDSVLSYIRPLEGIGLRLCIKDYKNAAFMENILIGENDSQVIPKAHAYDDSYTQVSVCWKENHFDVTTAVYEDDLFILVSCKDTRVKPSSMIIQGISLYNKGGLIERKNNQLLLNDIPIYVIANIVDELYVPLNTPYLAVSMENVICICTGKKRNYEEICKIIELQKENYEKSIQKYGKSSEVYRAMQTCQAWDTIYDPVLNSPITTVSRIWNKQWGGYVLFCWDTFFGALMQAVDNKTLAYSNVFAILDTATKEGFIPNYACQNGFKSFDRSQPPVGGMVCLEIYKTYKEKWFLEAVFEKLLKWNRWFYEHRITKNGLLTWGSDPYQLYYDHSLEHDGICDWQGASYESGLDNSPMYENIPFDYNTHRLLLDDVGLSGLYIEDCYSLAKMAQILELPETEKELLQRAEAIENAMETLWDENTGLYLNRRTDTDTFENRLSPFHFHALFSKKVSADKIARIINEHFYNTNEFWTNYPLPSIAKSDPSYVKQTYWQGRVWAPMNYLVFCALQKAGQNKAARDLAERSKELILKEWKLHGHVHENYDPETGEGCNNQRSDKFYHWGGLLSYIWLVSEFKTFLCV